MISVVVVALRPAGPADAAFLAEMVVAAAFWRLDGPTGTVDEVMAEPQLAHYVSGWPRPGDSGVIAEDGGPVGAAWLRFFPDSDPGYGFVDAATPELSIGLMLQWRGQGIGTRLINALLAQARGGGLTRISLSVEKDNPSGRLYERLGFQAVGAVGGSLTLLLQL
jgi:GNAT superfamily N-acetyltransferase